MEKPTDIQFRSLKALLTNSDEDNVVEMLTSYLNMNKDEIGILTAIRMDTNLVGWKKDGDIRVTPEATVRLSQKENTLGKFTRMAILPT